jgi:hypothetical protein
MAPNRSPTTIAEVTWRPTDDDLARLDSRVRSALANRDPDRVPIIGSGPLSTALGWPDVNPVAVCHRTGPMTRGQAIELGSLVAEYRRVLGQRGIRSIETEVRYCPGRQAGDHSGTGYVIQPMPRPGTLGHQVLGAASPDADHPLVAAVVSAALQADRQASLGAGFSQWSWDGSTARLASVGAPLMWDQQGTFRYNLDPPLAAIPFPMRAVIRGQLEDRAVRNQAPDNVLVGMVADLLRRKLDHWVQPVRDHCARSHEIYVSLEEARDHNTTERRLRTTIGALQRIERWWRESAREQPYPFFVPGLLSRS